MSRTVHQNGDVTLTSSVFGLFQKVEAPTLDYHRKGEDADLLFNAQHVGGDSETIRAVGDVMEKAYRMANPAAATASAIVEAAKDQHE